MSRLRLPLAAGLATAAVAFAAVALATDDDGDEGGPRAERASRSADADVAGPGHARGREMFARMGCGSCHRLAAAGSSGQIGPDLDPRLPDHTRASLSAKILAPGQASPMPGDFGARMSEADLDALVNFLLAASPSR